MKSPFFRDVVVSVVMHCFNKINFLEWPYSWNQNIQLTIGNLFSAATGEQVQRKFMNWLHTQKKMS
jgi:hypothetical protein